MIYMRASTETQDASRAEDELKTFAAANGLTICGWYRENISGTQLERPQLNKLLHDAGPGFVLLVEKLDRLSRLTRSEWEQLKERIRAKRLRIVCCDIPTTLAVLQENSRPGRAVSTFATWYSMRSTRCCSILPQHGPATITRHAGNVRRRASKRQ
jgi:DNA invertase Pin-like site-specific DNA recombinase